MDPQDELERLKERASILENTIQNLDYQIEQAMHAVAAGTDDIGSAMMALTDRHNAQLGFMFDLGKVEAQMEIVENRIREQQGREREAQATVAWEDELSSRYADHLDWMRPVLDAPEVRPVQEDNRPPRVQAEERMLLDMLREDIEPEDYLDWWIKRG